MSKSILATYPSDALHGPSRRQFFAGTGAILGAGLARGGSSLSAAESTAPTKRFRLCFNTSTIRGQGLDAAQEIDVVAKAGYDAIEPWFGSIRKYLEAGGKLEDLRKRIGDHGLSVENGIGFAKWIVNDPAERAAGLEEAKRDMDVIARLGGTRIAAPPSGVAAGESIPPDDVAERYRALLDLGDEMGVTPLLEMWGGNATIGTVEKALYIAARADHPRASFLGDVFHIYRSGANFSSLLLLGPRSLQHFHVNDYPADPPREKAKDSDRIFPGDGVAPLGEIIRNFQKIGAHPTLSLELFNPDYWKLPAEECARTGLEKMKAMLAAAGSPA